MAAPLTSSPAPTATPLRILVLEDVPMDAELLEYELGRAGVAFEATCVGTREAFTRTLREWRPDLILSDYSLPGFDGMAALRLAQELAPAVPFIVVTGSINEETAVGCMKAGAADYLLKNNLARIGPAIEAAMARQQARIQQQQAEAALRRSEASLRAIFRSVPQDLVLFDRDGVVQMLNKRSSNWALWLLGRDLRRGDRLADLIPPELIPAWDELFARALAGEIAVDEQEVPDRSGAADAGETRWFEATLIPVVDEGQVIGVCLGVLNIDDRKRAEDHFRRAERMEAVGRLAGGVAHEVNNMLTVIQGYASFLHGALDGDDRREDVGEILKASERAAGVTQQLLAFSRQQILKPSELDLNSVVRGLEAMLRRMLGETHSLELRLREVQPIRADRSQLEQVLVNLALNARDAMPGNGRLSIESTMVELDEPYLRRRPNVSLVAGRYVQLAVTDTGVGMDARTQARIFEPFFTTKPVGQGTGLGLSTVYGIVKQSGGYVWVYSEPGLGSTFKIYLPALPAAAGRDPAEPEPRATRGTELILIVEDEDMVRSIAARALRERGYTVVEAPSGAAGLRLLREHQNTVDLVISDVVMPELSGRQFAEQLAEMRPGLPVLFISGYTGDDVVRRDLLPADAPFLQKPFAPDLLARRVRDLLDARVESALD